MKRFQEYLQQHPRAVKYFILGYVVFAGCFTFPLWSEKFPLDFMKVYLIVGTYGIIALALAAIYGAKQEKKVWFFTFLLTAIGLLCRFFLEFGEVSNTYNFTFFNVICYLLGIPLFTTVAYHFIVKHLVKS